MHKHVVLLGDSVFDNAAYVDPGQAVCDHLRAGMAEGDQLSMLAVDGAVIDDVFDQLEQVPADVTHVVLSAGGNDALRIAGQILHQSCRTVAEGLACLGPAVEEFQHRYNLLLDRVMQLGRPCIACSIYNQIPGLTVAEQVGLAGLNDVISRQVFAHGMTLLDLRLLCDHASDFSGISPIEPSAQGGKKIATAIAAAIYRERVDATVIWRSTNT